jgi:polyketide synthase PksL
MAPYAETVNVAIIGIGLRLPGAETLTELWRHLEARSNLLTEVTPERWDPARYRGDAARERNKTSSIWAGFVDGADRFDAAFFNISPREAASMDPQQRIALELAWHAIEDAGYAASDLAGSDTGVFMGICHHDYAELMASGGVAIDAYFPTGTAYSIVANRISHFFDLSGPSVANDTACSSALVAIDQAVRHIRSGDCAAALAGAVNLCWSPNHFIGFSKAGMLSPTGGSRAFDSNADGYVRGEGGGILLLKNLALALADGDPIHGVIKGVATNHGGRTNSLTHTNPRAQARLIADLYRKAGIGPETVSYVETHGPGTPLGDPIEVAGLKMAFSELAEAEDVELPARTCALGSVKTNIGHLEAAAGVAGVAKVLAAMAHRTLPANQSFEKLNPLIKLDDSPFYILDQARPWDPRPDGGAVRAGISAFGFGGTNAHMVLEAPPAESSHPPPDDRPAHIFPFSARTPKQLAVLLSRFAAFLEHAPNAPALDDIAFTLQIGREPMRARAAFVASSTETLLAQLRAWNPASAKPSDGPLGMRPEENSAERVEALDPAALAEAWTAGAQVDWSATTGGRRARRCRLPLYPFDRQRHWFAAGTAAPAKLDSPAAPTLRKVEGPQGMACFETVLRGDAPYLADHRVGSQRVLPAVVYLQLVRQAVLEASADGTAERPAVRLSKMAWAAPLVIGDAPVTVQIAVSDAEGQPRRVEVRSKSASDPLSPRLHCQGYAETVNDPERPLVDLDRLEAACGMENVACGDAYEQFRKSGMHYGVAMRGLAEVRLGDNRLFARIEPPHALGARDRSPVLLDSAVQGALLLALRESNEGASTLPLPFAVETVTVFDMPHAETVAYVAPSPGCRGAAPARTYDLLLCEPGGRLLVDIRGYGLRAADGFPRVAPPASEGEPRVTSFKTWAWQAAPPESGVENDKRGKIFFAISQNAARCRALSAALGAEVTATMVPDFLSLPERAEKQFTEMLKEVQAALPAAPDRHSMFLVVVPGTDIAPVHAPLLGLLRTAEAENPAFFGRVVVIEDLATQPIETVESWLRAELRERAAIPAVRYDRTGRREVRALRDLPAQQTRAPEQGIRPGAAYWITGGLGGLGRLFARHIGQLGGKVLLTGRSAPGMRVDAALADLRQAGVEVNYVVADTCSPQALAAALAFGKAELGPIRGVIHAAGILDDAYIRLKRPESVGSVLAPKITGTLMLENAVRGEELDFLVLFSSMASIQGNPGQCDYAGANAFLNLFAAERQTRVAAGACGGRTLAICWPYWSEGGMAMDDASVMALRRTQGREPLATKAGLEAFDHLLGSGVAGEVAVFHVNSRAPVDAVPARSAGEGDFAPPGADDADDATLSERLIAHLRCLLAEITQVREADIDCDQTMEEYGLDSFVIVEMTGRLEEVFGPLSKTLMFEHITLSALATYFIAHHRGAAVAIFGGDARDADAPRAPQRAEAAAPEGAPAVPAPPPQFRSQRDIAVIGLAGRYPGAPTLDDLWKLLSSGANSFGAVPPERWDHARIYNPRREVLGKTVIRNGAFLDDIDKFDPQYFRISQREAELMSPEVRMFLEVGTETFENAGYSKERLQRRYGGDVAVLAGTMSNHYGLYGFQNNLRRGAAASGSYTGTLPNMLSYFYGLTGPSIFVDTMCSASATCIHQAVMMLRAGECRMALAGGINLILHPYNLVSSSQEHFTTATAEVIRSYGLGTDGTIIGEGVGATLLKPLEEAEADGDHIYAVIKGTAISNAGPRNGFTVPAPRQQAVAIEKALDDAGVDARTISYVEGHGSGTKLGDPVEIRALTMAFERQTRERGFCAIGSVKSNVSHLLAAAGIAGFTKVMLQLEHQTLVPSLSCDPPNPEIPFAESPFRLQQRGEAWERPVIAVGGQPQLIPRRAGITSIGAGGMNSHIVVEEYVPADEPEAVHQQGASLFVVSAMNPDRLAASLRQLQDFVGRGTDLSAGSVAYSLQVGKNELPCRLSIIALDLAGFSDAIGDVLARGLEQAFVTSDGTVRFVPNCRNARRTAGPADLERALDRGDLPAIADGWTTGASVDWDRLHMPRRPKHTRLPAYPFERVRCWVETFPDAPTIMEPLDSREAPAWPEDENGSLAPPETLEDSGSAASLRAGLVEIAADLLKFEAARIDVDATFFELGFDSISLVELTDRISQRFGTRLRPTALIERPTISALAGLLAADAPLITESRAEPTPTPTPVRASLATATAPDTCPPKMKVAIVGVAARLPGAPSLQDFWINLRAGDCQRQSYPSPDRAYSSEPTPSTFRHWAAMVEDVDRFDAAFFNISRREAELMDPQQRLSLETVWHLIEDAGYTPAMLPRTTGVFVGVSGLDYAALLARSGVPADPFINTGNSHAMLANRISYFLDLNGPSEPVDTACSSSLVAVHRAVEAIRSGRCDMAIAGGVNLLLDEMPFIGAAQAGMLAPDGRCKTFSADADGYVRGEGVGFVLLKPLSKAEADGDQIRGVVLGSAQNHGGRALALTAPSPAAQADVIERAMRGIDPATVDYVEAHGTGTSLGDPSEIEGLKRAFARGGAAGKDHACGIGSVKSNIGHLEAAAGIAGLLKVLLVMEHGEIPASLHADRVNPQIDLADSPFYLVGAPVPWRTKAAERSPRRFRAGVSSFGFGGVNAHLVVEDHPTMGRGRASGDPTGDVLPYAVLLSAMSPGQINSMAAALEAVIRRADPEALDLRDLAYTLQTGRVRMDVRIAVLAHTREQLLDKLQALRMRGEAGATVEEPRPEVHDPRLASALADWGAGGEVDWRALYGAEAPRRVSLPGYRFDRARFWVPAVRAPLDAPVEPRTIPPAQTMEAVIDEVARGALEIDDAVRLLCAEPLAVTMDFRRAL